MSRRECPYGVMAKVLDSGGEVNECKLQSFILSLIGLGRGMKSTIFPAIGQIVSLLCFYKDDSCIK